MFNTKRERLSVNNYEENYEISLNGRLDDTILSFMFDFVLVLQITSNENLQVLIQYANIIKKRLNLFPRILTWPTLHICHLNI